MTDKQKQPHINEVKCIRALDGLISGSCMIILFLFFSRLLIALPILIAKYLYLIPVLFSFITIMNIPKKLHTGEKWISALGRLRLFAFIALGVSPFWAWWHYNLNVSYFLINNGIFVFSLVLCLYNMISIVSASAEEYGYEWFFVFTRFARLALIYILIAPILAFFVTIWLGQNGGKEIIIVLLQIQGWDLFVFGVPFALAMYIMWHWRLLLVRNLMKDSKNGHIEH
jgi:hypothetical protein